MLQRVEAVFNSGDLQQMSDMLAQMSKSLQLVGNVRTGCACARASSHTGAWFRRQQGQAPGAGGPTARPGGGPPCHRLCPAKRCDQTCWPHHRHMSDGAHRWAIPQRCCVSQGTRRSSWPASSLPATGATLCSGCTWRHASRPSLAPGSSAHRPPRAGLPAGCLATMTRCGMPAWTDSVHVRLWPCTKTNVRMIGGSISGAPDVVVQRRPAAAPPPAGGRPC